LEGNGFDEIRRKKKGGSLSLGEGEDNWGATKELQGGTVDGKRLRKKLRPKEGY